MVVPDFGNPLHRRLFIDYLFRDAFIENGKVFLPLSWEGYPEYNFGDTDELPAGTVTHIEPEEFGRRSPALPDSTAVSARGQLTEKRVKARSSPSVHERVLQDLSDQIHKLGLDKDFSWDLNSLPNAPDEVVVQARRLTDYLLNPTHEKGSSKAKFLKETVGIEADDWRYLHAQLIDALANATFEEVRVDGYGIRFDATLCIRGRDERLAAIKTVWIIRSGERATLITAVPGDRSKITPVPIDPGVLPPSLKDTERWPLLYEAARSAGEKAAEECVPTPMQVHGFGIVMEGEMGGAYVLVRDARRGFARWLRLNGHAGLHFRGGARVYARTQTGSVDRARAYVEAFASILRRNGVESTVDSYLA
jgi:hypothetical protein